MKEISDELLVEIIAKLKLKQPQINFILQNQTLKRIIRNVFEVISQT